MSILSFNNFILGRGDNVLNYVTPPDPYNPLGLPPYTIRTRWTEGITPTITGVTGAVVTQVSDEPNIWDITYQNTNWNKLFYDSVSRDNLIEVLGANTTDVRSMGGIIGSDGGLFNGCRSLESVALFDTSNVTSMGYMFYQFNNSPLTSLPLFDTSNVTNMASMLYKCTSLTSIPLFNTVNVTGMTSFARYCSSLINVPLLNTSNLTRANNMFSDCSNVEGGALALYNQMSSQGTVTSHLQTFRNCGSNTQTGSAELAQIPSDWGGTYVPPPMTSFSGVLELPLVGSQFARGFNGLGIVWNQDDSKSCADVDGKTLRIATTGDVNFKIINWYRQNSDALGTATYNVVLNSANPTFVYTIANDTELQAFGDYSPIYMTWSAEYPATATNIGVSAKIDEAYDTMFTYSGTTAIEPGVYISPEPSDIWYCDNCGSENNGGEQCGNCGADRYGYAFEHSCNFCGAQYDGEQCTECGHYYYEEPEGEPE